MFFFFQAEDGIRDLTVTGVQTCALPIYGPEGYVFLVYAKVDGQVTAFVVDRSMKGFSTSQPIHKMGMRARDRKSTRLNSSHSQISYAVFCLKKKKNKNNIK